MQNINSTHMYNIFSKLLSKTAHIASNDIANIADSTSCYQQISTQHISPANKSIRNNIPIPQSACVGLKNLHLLFCKQIPTRHVCEEIYCPVQNICLLEYFVAVYNFSPIL